MKSKTRMGRAQREVVTPIKPINPFASLELLRPPINTMIVRQALSDTRDDRSYHPQGRRKPPVTLNLNRARLKVGRKSLTRSLTDALPYGLSFANPGKVVTCVKRRVRKEVLHALKKTGGGRRRKPPRRNFWSEVSC